MNDMYPVHVCLSMIIPVLVMSFDLNFFLKRTCTSGCCSFHCSFGFVCILGRFRYWKVNGMCVCVHVCVAHLSVIHICIHTWHNTAFTMQTSKYPMHRSKKDMDKHISIAANMC